MAYLIQHAHQLVINDLVKHDLFKLNENNQSRVATSKRQISGYKEIERAYSVLRTSFNGCEILLVTVCNEYPDDEEN